MRDRDTGIGTCDICSAVRGADRLNELVESIRTDGVTDVCDDCLKPLNAAFSRVRRAVRDLEGSWMQRIVRTLRERHSKR